MTNFVHLAVALTTDLEINKTGTGYDRHRAVVYGFNLFPEPDERGEKRSLEERRALLGCFYCTSMYDLSSIASRKMQMLTPDCPDCRSM